MEARCISTILESRGPLGKKGAFLAKLAFPQKKAAEFWLSEKQLNKLELDFKNTPKGYSCSAVSVYGVFDGDRFVWSGIQSAKTDDLPFLRSRFGVEIRPFSQRLQDVVEFDGEPIAVDQELIDE